LDVLAQCDASHFGGDRPGTIAACRAMARILDDETQKPQWPRASRELHTLLTSLQAPRKKSRGKLVQVQSLLGPQTDRKLAR
jgi:hypothetical protein